VLKGEVSTFSLELPPYRPPRVWQTIYTSVIDRTLIVLWRAIKYAAPAGALIWLAANITIGGQSIAVHMVNVLNPIGVLFAGLLLALSYIGGEAVQISLGISDKIARVFQGILLFFILACDTLILYRIRFVATRAGDIRAAE
jgi:ABC-type uncharacterized transport system permease subunit